MNKDLLMVWPHWLWKNKWGFQILEHFSYLLSVELLAGPDNSGMEYYISYISYIAS